MSRWTRRLILSLSAVLIVAGVAMLSIPAGLIAGGVLLVAFVEVDER